MLQAHIAELPQGDISFLRSEHLNPDKPTIFAIHGWLDNAASFIPVARYLPEYNLYAVDLPGHGQSYHRPKHSHYHFIDWVSDIVDLVELLFVDKLVVLLGHSLGGMLATVLAGLYPEKFSKLIIVDAAGLVTQQTDGVAKTMRDALDSRRRLATKKMPIHPSLESAINARVAAGDLTHQLAELLVERNIKHTERGFEWRTDQRLRTASPIRMSSRTAEQIIAAIDIPTLICLADNGLSEVKQNFHKFAKFYLHLSQVDVPGGHHCHMSHPFEIAEHIKAFI